MKIKKISDARAVAELLTTNCSSQKWFCPGYGRDYPCIQLCDEFHFNRIMVVLEQVKADQFRVSFVDTVNGTEQFEWLTISEIEEAIWHHRKFINQSGQLNAL